MSRAPDETVAGTVAPVRVVGSRRAAPMGRLETSPGYRMGTSGSAPLRSKMPGSEPSAPAKVRWALSLAPGWSAGGRRTVRNRRGRPGSVPRTPPGVSGTGPFFPFQVLPVQPPALRRALENRTVRARGHLALTLALRQECWGQGRWHPKVRQTPSPVPRRVLETGHFSPGGRSRFCRAARGALGTDPVAPATVRRDPSLAPRGALEIKPFLPARAVRALTPAPRRALEIEPFLPARVVQAVTLAPRWALTEPIAPWWVVRARSLAPQQAFPS
jgi:hypothetical protein